ncbi:putative membrane protein [Geobacillus kaustophilus]|uniref:Putative membrane protein n=1 Tax=Geobacillus kaustophilus TaxID=1462 RepID=A0A0D8BVU2_GEOKU|nr:putative membrane protein [Geobacillus kaustophilus]
MVAFIAWLFVGSFVMLVIMSMMVAAKRADEAGERWKEK